MDWMKKSFMLKEHDLPVMVFYDPITNDMKDTVYHQVKTQLRNVTKDNLIEESNKFIGHWYRMFSKSEPTPIDYGMAHKTVVGSNYPILVSDPD